MRAILATRVPGPKGPTPGSLTRARPELKPAPPGFTFLEMLVVMAMLALVGSVLVPAMSATRPGVRAALCMGNLGQLITGWQLYNAENSGKLVMNYHGGQTVGGGIANNSLAAPWAVGWLDWSTSFDNTNINYLVSDRYSKLAAYTSRKPEVWRCPADTYVSASQRSLGWKNRARSYSANLAVGDGNATSGPWSNIYKQAKKSSDLNIPGPAESFVFLDEHQDSINDPGFFPPQSTAWPDVPAGLHNGGAAFVFADGHTEVHRWAGSLDTPQGRSINYSFTAPTVTARDPDLHWASYHTPRMSTNSY